MIHREAWVQEAWKELLSVPVGVTPGLPREFEINRLINLEQRFRERHEPSERWEAHVDHLKDEILALVSRPSYSKKALFRLLRQWEQAVNFHGEFS